jgi:hypothetical protein
MFDIQKFYFLTTKHVPLFCIYLRTKSNYILIQHQLTGFYSPQGECLLRGTTWVSQNCEKRLLASPCPSAAWNNSASAGWISMKLDFGVFLKKIVEKIQA